MDLKNSKTEKNIEKVLRGEALANTKYDFFEKQAKKDGYEQIAEAFKQTSINEKEHAKIFYKILNNGKINHTTENLQEAMDGENDEWDDMYQKMANEARDEGFEKIAKIFDEIAIIEKDHEIRFKEFLNNIEEGKVFQREKEMNWECKKCGYTSTGKSAPGTCPVCEYSQGYFEIQRKNY